MKWRSFDRLAGPYRWGEYLCFGSALQRCRLAHLPALPQGRLRALLLGDGDGRFAAALLAARPLLQLVAIDSSQGMLRALRQRAEQRGAADRLLPCHGDALGLLTDRNDRLPAGCFDLAASHFFLDCLAGSEVAELARAVHARLAPGGVWVVSEFVAEAAWSRLLVRLLYLAFRLLAGLQVQALPPWREAMVAAGFRPHAEKLFLHGLLSSTLWMREP